MSAPRFAFKSRPPGAYAVFLDGEEIGTVWQGYNIYLRNYWIHSGVPVERRRAPMQAWPTREQAARALAGLPAEEKVS